MKRFELERAITENELLLHYQPIVEILSRRLTGVGIRRPFGSCLAYETTSGT